MIFEEKITEIITEMKALKSGPGDTEAVHFEADELLCKAIKLYAAGIADFLVRHQRQAEITKQAQELIDAWEELPKWYA